jgi:RNA polymerase sigma factor (sigma-70 family)
METWRVALDSGDSQTAWDLFLGRYRRLVSATIRRTLAANDDVADVFAHVCATLAADDLKVLRRFVEHTDAPARFSTWLVVVVRNQTIDWMRRRSGRRRAHTPAGLSELQREIFHHVFVDQRTHAESYELLRGGAAGDISYGAFLREVAQTYRLAEAAGVRGVPRPVETALGPALAVAVEPADTQPASDTRERLDEVMQSLPEELRLALQLFVVDEMPAAEVARTLGWRNAKDVYNRVYRALDRLRQALERQGIRRDDL